MFELDIATRDSQGALVRRFRVMAIVSTIIAASQLPALRSAPIFVGAHIVLAASMWFALQTLRDGRPWSRQLGCIVALCYFLTLTTGGILVGVAIFVVIWRASVNGAFRSDSDIEPSLMQWMMFVVAALVATITAYMGHRLWFFAAIIPEHRLREFAIGAWAASLICVGTAGYVIRKRRRDPV